jgi:predicted phage baseplate assembly protein
VATYRVGNGLEGNVGAEAICHAVFRPTHISDGIQRVRNPLPGQGGIAPEPIEEVKLFAPYAFRADLQRAISPDDYAELVMRDFKGKVQRAQATLRWTGSWYEVLVAVDPIGGLEADPRLLRAIEARLQRYRCIGHDLRVSAAQYVPLSIAMTICVQPDYLAGHVKAALLDLFSNRRLPDGTLGFFHPDNLTFGTGILLGKLVALAQSAPGVENVDVTELRRYEGLPDGELDEGILRLGPFEVARLDNDPGMPDNGLLKLKMVGGR